ncbi:MAG: hypothetical protein GY710_05550 [Desulfobacteraceae bacterium]|nr:hypothetical protein [Desulfobacteraceae bacterium]
MDIKGIVIAVKDIFRTFRVEDFSMISITATVALIGEFCTGLIPFLALAVMIYQLKIQRARLEVERLKLKSEEQNTNLTEVLK